MGHLAHIGKPVRGILRQGLENHPLQALWQMRIDGARGWERIVQVLDEDGWRSLRTVWRAARSHLVDHDTERVEVAPPVQFLAADLFRRHVDRRADDGSGASELGRALHDLGNAEVRKQT